MQSTVYSGSAFKADVFRPREVVELLVDEEEEAGGEKQSFLKTRKVRKKGPSQPNTQSQHVARSREDGGEPEEGTKSARRGKASAASGSIFSVQKTKRGEEETKGSTGGLIFATEKTTGPAKLFDV